MKAENIDALTKEELLVLLNIVYLQRRLTNGLKLRQ
jgi:hypothetical protein